MNKRKKRKIGRNQPCPCGSGNKYKRCCINKKSRVTVPISDFQEKCQLEFVSQFNQIDTLSKIAGLFLLPENHTSHVRIEQALRFLSSITHTNANKINSKHLIDYFQKFYTHETLLGMQEDPPENLFTESIEFNSGNFLIYPGISSRHSTYILQNLLDAIYTNPNKNSAIDEFGRIVFPIILGLLLISGSIGNRLHHTRFMKGSEDIRKPVFIPITKTLENLRNTVIFSKNSLNNMLIKFNTDIDCLTPFMTRLGDIKLSVFRGLNENPLLTRPLIELEDSVIMIFPASISETLRHFIWSQALIREGALLKQLIKSFNEILFSKVMSYCYFLHFEPLSIGVPPRDNPNNIKEAYFAIDIDKTAVIHVITDDGLNYSEKKPFSMYDISHITNLVKSRQILIEEYLKQTQNPQFNHVLFVTVVCGIGRGFSISENNFANELKILTLFADELDILSHLQEFDQLTLWKFEDALNKIIKTTEIASFSFLDRFALYVDHNHSFNIDNDRSPSNIVIESDYGRKLKHKSLQLFDRHVVSIGDSPIRVAKRHLSSDIPIYLPDIVPIQPLRLIKGYSQPIYVFPSEHDYKDVDFEFSDMFTYWIWQLTPSLNTFLQPLGHRPIQIRFILNISEDWFLSAASKQIPEIDVHPVDIKSTIENRTISIEISSEIFSHLLRADNHGERLIIRELLNQFRKLIRSKQIQTTLNNEICDSIIELVMPLGQKKQINLINSHLTPILHSLKIRRPRYLQQHDVERGLDGLTGRLGNKLPSNPHITSKMTASKLIKDIVDIYYKNIKKLLSQFKAEDLLVSLIQLYESIMYRREYIKLTSAPSIESYSSLEQEAEQLLDKQAKINPTALALRALIETIAAEPPRGSKIFNYTDYDALIANMYLLIEWAFISDAVHLDLIIPDIKIFNSGRIIANENTGLEFLRPFIRNKTVESVEKNTQSYRSYFEEPSDGSLTEIDKDRIESIFLAEFGINFSKQAQFIGILTQIGLDNANFDYQMSLETLKTKVCQELGWTNDEFNEAIELFSLRHRNKWERPPAGYTSDDIWPWLYNRRLSYIRKPIIIMENLKKELVAFWGPRNAYDSQRQVIGLIQSGRYKTNESSSPEMIRYIGRIKNKVGKNFELQVKDWLENNSTLTIIPNVDIKPRKQLDSSEDLGDIDNLVIDHNISQIFSLECKKINFGRNPKEIANEFDRLYRNTNSWINKHEKRDNWLKTNKSKIKMAFGLDSNDISVKSLIITAEEVPTPFIQQMPLKFISFPLLKRVGVKILYEN